MGFAIGFGSTERDFEEAERRAFEEYVSNRYNDLGCEYITDELAKDVADWLKRRQQRFSDDADGYKHAINFPDRYSYFFARVIHGASDIIALYEFMHINRRHALSPDGWALLQNRRLFDMQSYDIRKSKTPKINMDAA